jgi:predicted nucleic acid-binding Zn ribbon protein
MRKINTLFNELNEHNMLAKNVQAHQHLQQFWHAATPKLLSQNSFASSLNNGQLTVYADSSIVASKIKLTQASLLTQLQNLQLSNPLFRECKVTAISVKVQVKSRPKAIIKTPRKLSNHAATSLKTLAENLLVKNKGESALATKLKHLATKT